jgi:branched-chain amino acid aminotransferase
MPPEYIWRNGEFVKWADATVHVTAHALHYGSSVFEGIRAYKTPQGPAIFRLEPHAQRLLNSCKIAKINLTYSAEELSKAVIETVRRNGHEACYIRPIVFRSTTAQGLVGLEGRKVPVEVVIFTDDWGRYLGTEALDNGVDVQVSSWRRMAPDTFASMAKIGGQYINSQFVSMEAHDNGFSEGIALDINGYVSEGAGENLFVIIGDVVYTPGVWQSILSGVTRDSALTILKDLGYTIRYEPVAREMLYIADEMFFTGTAAEVTPIRSVDRMPVGEGKPGPITKAVQKEFFAITSGQKPDPYGWLTLVKQTEAAD